MKAWLFVVPVALAALAAALWWFARPAPLHEETARFGARQTGIELGAGFTSYVDLAALRAAYPEAVVITDIRRAATSAHPPRQLVTLELRPFVHLDVPGRLTLDFFNDRLMEVTFYPVDANVYAPVLARAEPRLRREGANRQVGINGHRRVAANIAQQASSLGPSMGARPFVLWQDLRLRRELDDWDARFGHLPQPAGAPERGPRCGVADPAVFRLRLSGTSGGIGTLGHGGYQPTAPHAWDLATEEANPVLVIEF